MGELMIRTVDLPDFTNKELASATKKIASIGTKIARNLYEVSTILANVDERESYKDDGFKSTVDYAIKTFGFKKTSAYSLLKIGKEYTAPSLESNLPHESGKDFTTTQIEKVLPLKDREKVVELVELGEISPDMSCKEIEKVVKDLTRPENENTGADNAENSTNDGEEVVKISGKEYQLFNILMALSELESIMKTDEIAIGTINQIRELIATF